MCVLIAGMECIIIENCGGLFHPISLSLYPPLSLSCNNILLIPLHCPTSYRRSGRNKAVNVCQKENRLARRSRCFESMKLSLRCERILPKIGGKGKRVCIAWTQRTKNHRKFIIKSVEVMEMKLYLIKY